MDTQDPALKKKKQMLDKKQLMLNLRKLQLQRKAVSQGAETDMRTEQIKSFKQFLAEGGLARAIDKSKTKVTGHISADRGSDEKKNKEKRKGLEKDLKKKGIGYKKGVGEYKYDDGKTGTEVSYHTSKPDKMSKRRFGKLTRRLGRKHGQESVITKKPGKSAKLHDTQSKKPGKSISLGKEKPGKHPQGSGQTGEKRTRGSKLSKSSNKDRNMHYDN